jgi:multiple sugar transport system substrate-binding protein
MIDRGVSPRWVTAADEEMTRRAFQDGRAIFLRSWPYAMDLFAQPGSPVAGKVGIAPLPRDVHGQRGFGAAGGALLGVNARTRHPELAVALARFLTGEAGQRATADATGLYPTRRALYRDPELLRRHPQLPVLESLALAARPRPVTPAYLMLSNTLQPELSAVLVGTKSPRQAVADARSSLAHVLRGVAGGADVAAAR